MPIFEHPKTKQRRELQETDLGQIAALTRVGWREVAGADADAPEPQDSLTAEQIAALDAQIADAAVLTSAADLRTNAPLVDQVVNQGQVAAVLEGDEDAQLAAIGEEPADDPLRVIGFPSEGVYDQVIRREDAGLDAAPDAAPEAETSARTSDRRKARQQRSAAASDESTS